MSGVKAWAGFALVGLFVGHGAVAQNPTAPRYTLDPSREQLVREEFELRRARPSERIPDVTKLADYERFPIEGEHVFLPLTAIPDLVIKAFIAAEDPHFYSRSEIEPPSSGASISRLITVQLYFPPSGFSGRLTNKELYAVRRMLMEDLVVRTFSKAQILEIFLNRVYLGRKTSGVGAAAQLYFGKPVHKLELHETAYLAALAHYPQQLDLIRKTDKALERRNAVLQSMAEQGYIDRKAADAARAKPLSTVGDPSSWNVVIPSRSWWE